MKIFYKIFIIIFALFFNILKSSESEILPQSLKDSLNLYQPSRDKISNLNFKFVNDPKAFKEANLSEITKEWEDTFTQFILDYSKNKDEWNKVGINSFLEWEYRNLGWPGPIPQSERILDPRWNIEKNMPKSFWIIFKPLAEAFIKIMPQEKLTRFNYMAWFLKGVNSPIDKSSMKLNEDIKKYIITLLDLAIVQNMADEALTLIRYGAKASDNSLDLLENIKDRSKRELIIAALKK